MRCWERRSIGRRGEGERSRNGIEEERRGKEEERREEEDRSEEKSIV